MLKKTSLIESLNQVLNQQLMTIDQIYLHSRLYKKWGLGKHGQISSSRSSEMMLQLDQLITQINQLEEGAVESRTPENTITGTTVQLCLELDLKSASQCVNTYLKARALCNPTLNQGTSDLLNGFIKQARNYNDWLKAELNDIHSHGIETFIKKEMGHNHYWKLAAN